MDVGKVCEWLVFCHLHVGVCRGFMVMVMVMCIFVNNNTKAKRFYCRNESYVGFTTLKYRNHRLAHAKEEKGLWGTCLFERVCCWISRAVQYFLSVVVGMFAKLSLHFVNCDTNSSDCATYCQS